MTNLKTNVSDHFNSDKENGLDKLELLNLKDKVKGLKDDMHNVSSNFSDRDWKLHNNHIDNLLQEIDSKLKLRETGAKAVGIAQQPIRKITSIGSNRSVDEEGESTSVGEKFSKFGQDLTERRKSIQKDLENGTNIGGLKTRVSALREDLHKHAPDLSPYEAQLHNKHIDKLMNDVDDKLRLTDTREKVFEFAKKPISRLNSRGSSRRETGMERPIIDHKAAFMDLDFVLLDSNKVYKSLERCTLSSTDYNDKPKTGSLTIQYTENSVVSLQSLPFKNGSLFVSDASNCVFIFHTPKDDKVQVRFHNLYKCKILVMSDDYLSSKQTVVIENCKECIFHETCQTHVTIENFNSATKKTEATGNDTITDDTAVKFAEFDTYLGNIQALKSHYVH